MAAITAKMVNELRSKTGAGMMECKKALVETDGNFDEAIKVLREKGLGKADKKAGRVKELTPELCEEVVTSLRTSVNGGELFGKVRNGSFAGALSAIYQSFDGEDLYPSVAEKAANLLYFVIKDHPFYDGNKRIGSLLFIVFLTMNDYHLTENGETKISDRALTALALLVAESNPNEKELVVNLTRKLLV